MYPPEVQKQFEDIVEPIEKAILALRKYRERCNNANYVELEDLVNQFQFILFLVYDLTVLGYDCDNTDRHYTRIFYARHISTTIYESKDDLKHICGKPIKDREALIIGKRLINKYKKHLKSLTTIMDMHHEGLKAIRNIVSAHRDHDAERQTYLMEHMDVTGILELNVRYLKWLQSLIEIMFEMLSSSGIELKLKEIIANKALERNSEPLRASESLS